METTTCNTVQEAYNLGYEDGFKTANTHVTQTRYVKERTCKVVRRDRDEYGEFAEYSCGHANVWQSWNEPKFCCWCGAKVV